ncbi:MAG: hypothetical protein K1X64_07180 [Myxococcaceae bacterium]|nr:hypothetical protein [Myxococcaceae bacterium]
MNMTLSNAATAASKRRMNGLLPGLCAVAAWGVACGLPVEAQSPPNADDFYCFDNAHDAGPPIVDPRATGHFRPDAGLASVFDGGCDPDGGPSDVYPSCDGGSLYFDYGTGLFACGQDWAPDTCDGGFLALDEDAGTFYCQPYPYRDGGYRPIKDGGEIDFGIIDAGISKPGNVPLRGCMGCGAPVPRCDTSSEYLVSVQCHADNDGGWYSIGGTAGTWCNALPVGCGTNPSCECLSRLGAFSPGVGGTCPGNHWFCIEGSNGRPAELRCTPP